MVVGNGRSKLLSPTSGLIDADIRCPDDWVPVAVREEEGFGVAVERGVGELADACSEPVGLECRPEQEATLEMTKRHCERAFTYM
ncbi:hypothetical protein KXS11_12625 [Plantibacter flavus]|uniref:hypothetical protein n=1 Tax=Plantibacter flavus TaxID=150123 RepID=UPI003F192190